MNTALLRKSSSRRDFESDWQFGNARGWTASDINHCIIKRWTWLRSPDQRDYSANMEDTPLMRESGRTDLKVNHNRNVLNRNNEVIEDGEFLALISNLDWQTHTLHKYWASGEKFSDALQITPICAPLTQKYRCALALHVRFHSFRSLWHLYILNLEHSVDLVIAWKWWKNAKGADGGNLMISNDNHNSIQKNFFSSNFQVFSSIFDLKNDHSTPDSSFMSFSQSMSGYIWDSDGLSKYQISQKNAFSSYFVNFWWVKVFTICLMEERYSSSLADDSPTWNFFQLCSKT